MGWSAVKQKLNQTKTTINSFINTYAAKALKNQYVSAKHVLLIDLFYYLAISYFLKISTLYIIRKGFYVAEYPAISLIKLLPLNR